MANIISQTKWSEAPEYRDLPYDKQKQLYDEYVSKALAVAGDDTNSDINLRYREFLKNLLIYITQEASENQRFLKNIDFNKKEDLILILPFYVRRLKEIALYYINKREELLNSRARVNLTGSTEGFKRHIKKFILTLISDPSFISKHPIGSIPDFKKIVDNTAINVDNLYDLNTSYHDDIKDDVEGILYFDTEFKQSITKLFEKYPLQIKAKSGKILRTSKGSVLHINVKRTNYADLPLRHFFRGDKTLDNIEFNYKKKKYEKYAGSDYYYLSGDGSSGKLFSANAPHKNISNQRYPTIAQTNKNKKLKKHIEIGGWFIPNKFGITSLHTKGVNITYNTKGLSADDIITFPNPNKYGDISRTGKIKFTENHEWLKAGPGNNYIAGDIYDDNHIFLQKLWPYQSKEETLKFNFQGLSRAEDPVDFWVGTNKEIWANEDIYPKLPFKQYNVDAKQDDLLITDESVDEWFIDSFGNEFALRKETHPSPQTTLQQSGEYTEGPGNLFQRVEDVYDPSAWVDHDGDLFKPNEIKLYEHTYAITHTKYETSTNSLTSNKSLFDRKHTYGKIYYRNAFSSVVGPLEEMYESLFIKYINDDDIYDELKNKIKSFDIFNDIIVVQTEKYLVIEKYFLDSDTGYVKAAPTPKVIFKTEIPAYEKIGKPWLYEDKNQLFVIQTKLHPYVKDSNFKLIYPQIHIVNLDTLKITKAFPNRDIVKYTVNEKPFETYTQFVKNNISLLNANTNINFVKVGNPQISFNKGTNTYAITYTAHDEFNYTYLFTLWLKRRGNAFFIARSTLLTPDKNVFSLNFKDFRKLEEQITKFIKIESYSTTDILHSRTLPISDSWHGFMTDYSSLLLGGREITTGADERHIYRNAKDLKYGSAMNRTTYFGLNSAVQGEEKITLVTDVAFYKSENLKAHGSTVYFQGAYDKKTLKFNNNILDTNLIAETGYTSDIILHDAFINPEQKGNESHVSAPISELSWGAYNGGVAPNTWSSPGLIPDSYRVIREDVDKPGTYYLEIKSGQYRNGGGVFGGTQFKIPEIPRGKRYKLTMTIRTSGRNNSSWRFSNQLGNGQENNLSFNFTATPYWRSIQHEIILDGHKPWAFIYSATLSQTLHIKEIKLEQLTSNSSLVVDDNFQDWGNIELFKNTNGYSAIKDKMLGVGLDFSKYQTIVFDDFEDAYMTNIYKEKSDAGDQDITSAQINDNHSTSVVHSKLQWNAYKSGYKQHQIWPRGVQNAGDYRKVVNDNTNPNNQVLEIRTGPYRNGGSASGGSILYLPKFEEGKTYKLSTKMRIHNDDNHSTMSIGFADWGSSSWCAGYIWFNIDKEWKTYTHEFTVFKAEDTETGGGNRPKPDNWTKGNLWVRSTSDYLGMHYSATAPTSAMLVDSVATRWQDAPAPRVWYVVPYTTNQAYLQDATFQIDHFMIEEVIPDTNTRYKVFDPRGGTIASGSFPALCPTVSARSDIVFNQIKAELEIEAGTLTLSTKTKDDSIFVKQAIVDISGQLDAFPPLITAGICNLSDVNIRTNCEIKKFSLTGGIAKPDTTIFVEGVRTKQ